MKLQKVETQTNVGGWLYGPLQISAVFNKALQLQVSLIQCRFKNMNWCSLNIYMLCLRFESVSTFIKGPIFHPF